MMKDKVTTTSIKVLMVVKEFPPNFGGAAIQSIYLSHALKALDVNITFISDNGSKRSKKDQFEGFRVFRISTLFKKRGKCQNFIFAIRLLIFIFLHRSDYHIIHFHATTGYETLLFPLLKFLNKKVILKLTLTDCDDPTALKRRKLGILFFWCLKFADKMVGISKKLIELTLKSGIDEDKIEYIPNGVDTSKFLSVTEKEKVLLKKRLGFYKFDKLFFSAGKIEERKRYKFLLESWKFISGNFLHPALLIAGPGNDENNKYYLSLKNFIKKESLQNVFFLGKIDNVDEYMKMSDCFLFCSKQEGFANVLLESAASSIPVGCRYIEGITDAIIENEYIGQVCYSDSPLDFANLAVSVLTNQNKKKQEQAFKAIKEKFDIRNIALRYKKIYNNLLL